MKMIMIKCFHTFLRNIPRIANAVQCHYDWQQWNVAIVCINFLRKFTESHRVLWYKYQNCKILVEKKVIKFVNFC